VFSLVNNSKLLFPWCFLIWHFRNMSLLWRFCWCLKRLFFVAFPLWQSSLPSLGSTLFPCSKCKKYSWILIEVNHLDSIGKFMLLFVKFVGINCLCVLCPRLVAEVQIVCNWLRYNHVTHFDLDVGHKILIHFVSSGNVSFSYPQKGNTLHTSKSVCGNTERAIHSHE
jgi:hypothetical protein